MKKKILYTLLLSVVVLTGCGQNTTKETPASIETIEQSNQLPQKTSHTLNFGEPLTFADVDYKTIGYPVAGLKMTVKPPIIDENIVLGKGYPEEDQKKFEGKKALVITVEVENTTSDYIDLVYSTVLNSEGKTLDFTFVDGVSTQVVNGLTAGQKATIVTVYPTSDDNPVTYTYANATWKAGNTKKKESSSKSDKNSKKSSKENTKIATKNSSSKQSKTQQSTNSQTESQAVDTTVIQSAESTAQNTNPVSLPPASPNNSSSRIVDQHGEAGVTIETGINTVNPYDQKGDGGTYFPDGYDPELEAMVAEFQRTREWYAPNEFELRGDQVNP